MEKNVLIVGNGEIGQAIQKVLSVKDISIRAWDKNSGKNTSGKNLEELLAEAYFIFICIPSSALKEILMSMRGKVAATSQIIFLTKGINKESGKTADLLIDEVLGSNQNFGLLAGPMIAEELAAGGRGYSVIASGSRKLQIDVLELFKNTGLTVVESDDVHGTALASVLKNVYSVALGVIDGLNLGANTKSSITKQAINEMSEIVVEFGGKMETVYGWAGLGDLIATGFSQNSLNHKVGFELATQNKIPERGEGADSLPPLLETLKREIQNYPLLNFLKSVIIEGKNPKKLVEEIT